MAINPDVSKIIDLVHKSNYNAILTVVYCAKILAHTECTCMETGHACNSCFARDTLKAIGISHKYDEC